MRADASERADASALPDASEFAAVLFYRVVPLADARAETAWQRALCEHLALGGRLRVAANGLNGTLSGARTALGAYVAAIEARHGGGIDWKFGALARAQLFPSLSVRHVAELVCLGAAAGAAPLERAGPHLPPREFDAMLRGATKGAGSDAPVLIDVRNQYEWAIGRFDAPGVPLSLRGGSASAS